MPAHITINVPFIPVDKNRTGAVDGLKDLFSHFQQFRYSLIRAKRWPGVLYLEPSPGQPLVDLIHAVVRRFPESPPYGGLYPDVVPHLTVAVVDDEDVMKPIEKQFAEVCAGILPIHCVAHEVWLMDNKPGKWTKRVCFPLEDRH